MRTFAEYFDRHEDAGGLLDPPVDNAEIEEATKAKLKELDRLAEFGVYETVDILVVLGKKRVTEHGTRHRPFESQEVVSPVHSRRDQRVLPRERGRRMLRGPIGRVVGTAARTGESDFCALSTAKTVAWLETRWNTPGRFHGRTL